jgi:hypothetical protein
VPVTWPFVSEGKHEFVRTAHTHWITSPLVTTEIEALVKSWRRDLRARNLAPKTVKTYGESADQLVAHLAGAGVTTVDAVTREHVSDFITHLLAVLAGDGQRAVPGAAAVLLVARRRGGDPDVADGQAAAAEAPRAADAGARRACHPGTAQGLRRQGLRLAT